MKCPYFNNEIYLTQDGEYYICFIDNAKFVKESLEVNNNQ